MKIKIFIPTYPIPTYTLKILRVLKTCQGQETLSLKIFPLEVSRLIICSSRLGLVSTFLSSIDFPGPVSTVFSFGTVSRPSLEPDD